MMFELDMSVYLARSTAAQITDRPGLGCLPELTFLLGRFPPFLYATKALRVSKGIALIFLGPRHSRWGWGVCRTPRPPLPPGNIRYPLYRKLGGPQGRSGRAENLVPNGIRSRTIQPAVSRYTDWATRPIHFLLNRLNFGLPSCKLRKKCRRSNVWESAPSEGNQIWSKRTVGLWKKALVCLNE